METVTYLINGGMRQAAAGSVPSIDEAIRQIERCYCCSQSGSASLT